MRLQQIPMIGGLFLVLVSTVGCTAAIQLTPVTPLGTDLHSYSAVVFLAESKVPDDVRNEVGSLQLLTVTKIRALNAFKSVELGDGAGSGSGTLLVKATISSIKKVSSTARFMLGAFAGRASMTMDIVFVDAASGKQLGAYAITGKSGGTGYSGGTSDAVRKAADGIADILAKNYSGH